MDGTQEAKQGKALDLTPTWQRAAYALLPVARHGDLKAQREAGEMLGHIGGMLDAALAGMQAANDATTLDDAKAALAEAFARMQAIKQKVGL